MIVYRVQHIFTKRFSICLTGEGQSREKGTQAEKKTDAGFMKNAD